MQSICSLRCLRLLGKVCLPLPRQLTILHEQVADMAILRGLGLLKKVCSARSLPELLLANRTFLFWRSSLLRVSARGRAFHGRRRGGGRADRTGRTRRGRQRCERPSRSLLCLPAQRVIVKEKPGLARVEVDLPEQAKTTEEGHVDEQHLRSICEEKLGE